MGFLAGLSATVDSSDQFVEAPPSAMGCDGVPDGKLSQAQTMGLAKTTAAAAFANGPDGSLGDVACSMG